MDIGHAQPRAHDSRTCDQLLDETDMCLMEYDSRIQGFKDSRILGILFTTQEKNVYIGS